MKKYSAYSLALLMLVACQTRDYSYRYGKEDSINLYLKDGKEEGRYNVNGFNLLNELDLHMLPPYRGDTTNLKHFVILDAVANEISVYSNGKYYYYKAVDTTSRDVLYNFKGKYPPY